jgi:hypothetical protein
MRIALLGGLCLAVALAPAASADGTTTLTAGKPTVLTGHLSGAATYGPFLPSGQAVPDECVSDGCRDHQVRVVVPKGQLGQIAWAIDAPATGPGVDLRIYDSASNVISSSKGGAADTPTPSTASYGTTRKLKSGTYRVRTSIIGGVTDYEATLS